jgi:hypothetical protein
MSDPIDPRGRFTWQAERDFRASVRPVYRNNNAEPLPVHIGTCLLLSIDGIPVIATAAHILDQVSKHTLYVAGPPGTNPVKPVPVLGGSAAVTLAPDGNRDLDHFDIAMWRPLPGSVDALGNVHFIRESQISRDSEQTENRLYTALGYPVSRNKKAIDHAAKKIDTHISMYTANVEPMPALAEKLGVSISTHLFQSFKKSSFTNDGERVNTFGPRGLSGGAFLDLGEFTSPESYERDPNALLSGMVIEYHREHDALVAVKIGVVINTIRRAMARAPLRGAGTQD